MRLLFSSHGAFGHVLPIVGLAGALRNAGHDICVATGESLCATVESLGLAAVTAGMSDDTLIAEARRRWPETEHQPPSRWAPRMFTEIAAPTMLADLQPIIDRFRPELVIREEGEHAAPVAATLFGIPWLTVGWGSPLPAMTEQATGRIAPLWHYAGLAAPGDELYGQAVLDPCPPSLYGETGPPRPVVPIRATPLPATRHVVPHRHHDRRLAYVGFGTVPLYSDQPELIEAVVTALLSHSFDAIVTTKNPRLASRLTALDPDRVRVEQWISLPDLLEACDLVVSHGGAGTVLAALTAGVPLLLLPRGAPSQNRMSHACQARGVAQVIDTDRVTADQLDRVLTSLAADDRYSATARELADEIAATPTPDQLVPILEQLTADATRETPGGF